MNKLCVSVLLYIALLCVTPVFSQDSMVDIIGCDGSHAKGAVVHKFNDGSGLGYVITAQHVYKGCKDFKVVYSNGQVCKNPTLLEDGDDPIDLALILVWLPEDTEVLKIRPTIEILKDGDKVKLRLQKGDIEGIVSPATNKFFMYVNSSGQHGDSGSPILDSEGRLCGVLTMGWEHYKINDELFVWPIKGTSHSFVNAIVEFSLKKGYLPTEEVIEHESPNTVEQTENNQPETRDDKNDKK